MPACEHEDSKDRVAGTHRYGILTGLVLVAATLLMHGWSLGDGTVLDDHWHQRGLREHGWSPSELVRTTVIEPSEFLHIWWQDKPVRWEYGRPFFILAMKVVYGPLGGNDPFALHVFSLLLHFTSACMVCRLCLLLTRRWFWSAAAGVMFTVYPHAVISVSWPSAQNTVLVVTLMLAALLCYRRASGLCLWHRRPDCGPTAETAVPQQEGAAAQRLSRGWFAFAVGLWLLALFTRENALMLPAFLFALDWAFGPKGTLRARSGAYTLFALIGLAFVVWRVTTITQVMPDVYLRLPAGDPVEYGLWCIAKLLHYLCTSVFPAAMLIGPTGRYDPWTEAPGDCVLMLTIVAVVGVGYFLMMRRARGAWIWPMWIVLAIVPVIPVIATPHSGYLGGVGFAVGACLVVTAAARAKHAWVTHLGRVAVVGYLLAFGVFSAFHRLQWSCTINSERHGTESVLAAPPAPSVKDVFFLNLPFVNIYMKPALDAELGPQFRDVRCHALTFAPQALAMKDRCWVTQIDERRFSIRVEGQPYFSRLLGRFLIDGFRESGRLHQGDVVRNDLFEAEITEADDQGVREMVFSFNRPLADPSFCFYLATPGLPATQLRFLPNMKPLPPPPLPGMPGPNAPADTLHGSTGSDIATTMDELFVRAMSVDGASPEAEVLRLYASSIAAATGAPVQRILHENRISPEQWARIRLWWWQCPIDDETFRIVNLRRMAFVRNADSLKEIDNARGWARLVFPTDLYLAGDPFPGPR